SRSPPRRSPPSPPDATVLALLVEIAFCEWPISIGGLCPPLWVEHARALQASEGGPPVASGSGCSGWRLFAPELQTEFRMLSASDDFDGDYGSRLAFLEKRIDRPQQHGLIAGGHLRDFGVRSGRSV